jgi:hypothetical protein
MWYTLKDFHPIRGPKENTKEKLKLGVGLD